MIARIGTNVLRLSEMTGQTLFLAARSVAGFRLQPRALRRFVVQMARVGADSLPVVSLMAVFVGMVLALQSGYALAKYGTEGNIGPIVGLSITRELAPVLTALLLAGRVGASMAAELGTMAVSEEIDALRTLRVNPVRYLATPRVYACTLMLPILVIYADIIGILGGGVVASSYFHIPMDGYLNQVWGALSFGEIARGLFKATVFGFLISIISCQQGFSAQGGAEGVGRVTIRAVVYAFIAIFVSNYFTTRLWL